MTARRSQLRIRTLMVMVAVVAIVLAVFGPIAGSGAALVLAFWAFMLARDVSERRLRCVAIACCIQPVLWLAAFWLQWLTAWAVLGHMPRPSIDDPKSIHPVLGVFEGVSALLMITLPCAFIATPFLLLGRNVLPTWLQRPAGVYFTVVAWLVPYAVFEAWVVFDPFDIIKWYMD